MRYGCDRNHSISILTGYGNDDHAGAVFRAFLQSLSMLVVPQVGVLATFVGNPPFSRGGLSGKLARASRAE